MGTDPGIASAQLSDDTVDLPTDTTSTDYKLNGPLPLRKARPTTAAKRAARIERLKAKADQTTERRATRRLWDGTPTKHQQRELDKLRCYELARDNDELPDLSRCMGGTTMVALVESGRLYPYPVARSILEQLGLDKKERAILQLLLGAQLKHGAEWVVARHIDFADSLEICETDSARAMRRLCRDSFVRQQPLYDEITIDGATGRRLRRHARGANAYQITGRVLVLLALREPDTMAERRMKSAVFAEMSPTAAAPVSEKYQATETPGLSGNPDGGARLVAAVLEEPAGEDAAGSISTDVTPAIERGSSPLPPPTRTAAPSEAPEGATDGRTPASRQRRLAMLQREIADTLDRLHEREARALQAQQAAMSEALARELAELRAERRRVRDLAANLLREAGGIRRPPPVAGDSDADYQRELEERRRLGLSLPSFADWQLEVQSEQSRRRMVLERVNMPSAELGRLLDDAAERAEAAGDDDDSDGGAS